MRRAPYGRILALAAALIVFGVYVLTAARTVTWLHSGADSGEFGAAAMTFGVPHPPGYPLYMLLASVVARLPLGEPAFGLSLLSAIAGAAAVYVLARAGEALIAPVPKSAPARAGEALIAPVPMSAPARAGEALIAPVPKSAPERAGQTLMTTAPARNPEQPLPVAFLVLPPLAALAYGFAPLFWSQANIPEVYTLNLLFVAVVLWACVTTSPRRIPLAALAFGLGMAHHLSILLLAPGALIALRPRRHDAKWLVLVLAPLLLYAYLPIAALSNSPVNWGNPRTAEGFLWLVSAAAYRPLLFAVNANEVLNRFAFSAKSLLDQFTLVGLALLLWGAIQLVLERTRLAVALLVMFAPVMVYAVAYATRDSYIYLLPAFAIALLWLVYGALHVLKWFGNDRVLRAVAVGVFALLPIYNLVTNYAPMDISRDRQAYVYALTNMAGLPTDAVIFADGDEALFALLYYRHAVAYENVRSVIVSQGLLDYAWYYDNLRRNMSEVNFRPPGEVTDAHARAEEIIRVTFAEGRTVCFTDSSPLLPEFDYEERGILKCVLAEKQ